MRSMIKRTLVLSGHCTSVALEPEFWSALDALAASREQTMVALVISVDTGRDPTRSLASALRVLALTENLGKLTDRENGLPGVNHLEPNLLLPAP